MLKPSTNRLFGAFLEIYRFTFPQILRQNSDVMLSAVISAWNWRKLNKIREAIG